ncbi:MAG: hypothetical protein JW746_01665 [Candidatus Krumholzibacteriota bacterium]|nr:hypothetical protein [Candidatus Krumholzibacteriota bacterium]
MIPSGDSRLIGYYGFPLRRLLNSAREKFGPGLEMIDLDIDHGAPDSGLLPVTTCRIISNIMNNSVMLRSRLAVIVAAVGEGKCDRGRNISFLLQGLGLNVIESRFEEKEWEERELIYSSGRGTLSERIDRIMYSVIDPSPAPGVPEPCRPTHGFWGVPPNDYRVLDLFPETTHIYGWTRCVEAGRPSDMEMESYVDEGVPTVFFTQSFCAKQDLAHYLAEKYGGIEVDCHREINDSILAKVEAFIRLS